MFPCSLLDTCIRTSRGWKSRIESSGCSATEIRWSFWWYEETTHCCKTVVSCRGSSFTKNHCWFKCSKFYQLFSLIRWEVKSQLSFQKTSANTTTAPITSTTQVEQTDNKRLDQINEKLSEILERMADFDRRLKLVEAISNKSNPSEESAMDGDMQFWWTGFFTLIFLLM